MKTVIIVVICLLILLTGVYFLEQQSEVSDNEVAVDNFIECLKNSGVVIYGSATCPACAQLVEEWEDYSGLGEIYVECMEEEERCNEEMLVGYVPAVQINGEVFDGWGNPENLARETGCEL